MSSNIESMSSWELCEYSMKTVRERKFVDGLGLQNWYKNPRGSVRLQHVMLEELASRVKEGAENLEKKYESKPQLQQAMDDKLFEDITNPLMESFAHRIWNGSSLSIRPYGRNTKLLYFIEKDQEWYWQPQIHKFIPFADIFSNVGSQRICFAGSAEDLQLRSDAKTPQTHKRNYFLFPNPRARPVSEAFSLISHGNLADAGQVTTSLFSTM
jgi:hypothetical protein